MSTPAPRRRTAAALIGLAVASSLFGCGGPEPASSGEGRYAHADVAVLPEMLKGLRSKDASTRARSAATIGGMGPAAREAVPALTALLKDRDVSVRAAGVHALGRMGSAARPARPNLEALLKQAPLREIAAKALKQIEDAD